MFNTIYIEDAVSDHSRTLAITRRFPKATIIPCKKYGEIFNRKAQNFRLQKKNPSLILAEKLKNHVLPAPAGYGTGNAHNYYFSHMLNCIYDCRYCFLQGMYRSAHLLLFVNYESFQQTIVNTLASHPGKSVHFFSGYDCDSLALEPVSGFAQNFLPFFAGHPNAVLELRTKGTQIRTLLGMPPINNCIIAFSFTPESMSLTLEHKVPSIKRRINAIGRLQDKGWRIGLRFDPLLYYDEYQSDYKELFSSIFRELNVDLIDSVSLGSFRLPKSFFHKMADLYPEELLFASPLETTEGMVSYKSNLKFQLLQFCQDEILSYVPEQKFHPCEEMSRISL